MSKPLVSVIMAAFNVGDFSVLDLAIGSIIQQDISEWELLICDDGSTDGTYEHLLKWEEKDDRIHVFRNECNKKTATARNRCIEHAQSEFVAIMDADDYSFPNRLKTQIDFLREHPEIAFVGSRGMFFRETPGDRSGSYLFIPEPQKTDFLMTLPFVHASVMFRKDVLMEVNSYCTHIYATRSEDYDLLMRLYAVGHRGINLNLSLYGIRINPDTYKRRKYRYRFNECFVKWKGFACLGLMPKGVLYAIKPLIVGLLPVALLEWLKNKYYEQQDEKYEKN